MEIYKETLCVSHAELTDGIMTNAALMHACQRDKFLRVRRACSGKSALYDVERFPSEYRAKIKRQCTAPDVQAQARAFIDTIMIDQVAATYYERSS